MAKLLNEDQKQALVKLCDLLKTNNIDFVVIGGLAATAWGCRRQIVDFDIQIDKYNLLKTRELLNSFIKTDIRHYVTKNWDIHQMIIELNGVVVDICQADDFFVVKNGKKYLIKNTIQSAAIKTVENITIPVMPLPVLIFYKSIIARPVDLQDIAVLKKA